MYHIVERDATKEWQLLSVVIDGKEVYRVSVP